MNNITELASHMRGLAEAATPGDWETSRHGGVVGGVTREYANGSGRDQLFMACVVQEDNGGDQIANASYVAAANPANVIAILDALEAVQAEVANFAESRALMLAKQEAQSMAIGDASVTIANLRARLAELESMTPPPGYKFVIVPEIDESEPDWDEVRRQTEVATGLKVEQNTYSIIIREVRRWIASTYTAADASSKLNVLFRKMQADMVTYLEPGNNCGKDWFVSRMIWHMDGPEQREAQGAAAGASPVQPSQALELSDAYKHGWVMAASWAHRDDLISDVNSAAYITDRDFALAAAAINAKGAV